MTVKEWLNRGYKLDTEINVLLDEQSKALQRATGTAAAVTGDKVQTSKRNTTEDKFIAYAAYSELIDKRIDELYEIKAEIMQAINAVDNTVLRTLLTLRYIRFFTWEQIAEEMEITFQWAHILHKRALKCINKFINS